MKTARLAPMSLLLAALAGCAAHLPAERNKEVARRAFDQVLEKGHFEVVPEVYAPDFRNGTATLEQDMAALRAWHSVLPADAVIRPDLVLGEGDYVTVLWTARATVKGSPLNGRGITIWRFENGRIREEWSQFDQERWMRELGLESLGSGEPKR
ncbi:MAG TPA: nuclear transport factor 2 family protein [Myxococcales bacterium]|nr:nuclear transport factor 2 family protein [Myxococcales bacterium]